MLDTVVRALSQRWWWFLVQGVLSVVLGVLALTWPGKTLNVLVILLGLFTLLNGVVEVLAAIGAASAHQSWGWRLAVGLFGILAGLAIFRWPSSTAGIILFLVGLWVIATGIVAIVAAIADRTVIQHAWLAALAGIISVFFGVAMFAWPVEGLLTLAYLVGIYAIVYGVMSCAIAFRLRGLLGHVAGPSAPPTAAPTA